MLTMLVKVAAALNVVAPLNAAVELHVCAPVQVVRSLATEPALRRREGNSCSIPQLP